MYNTAGWSYDLDRLAQNGIVAPGTSAWLAAPGTMPISTNPYETPQNQLPYSADEFRKSCQNPGSKEGKIPVWKKILTGAALAAGVVLIGRKIPAVKNVANSAIKAITTLPNKITGGFSKIVKFIPKKP
jgi:hypothetical protein